MEKIREFTIKMVNDYLKQKLIEGYKKHHKKDLELLSDWKIASENTCQEY